MDKKTFDKKHKLYSIQGILGFIVMITSGIFFKIEPFNRLYLLVAVMCGVIWIMSSTSFAFNTCSG